MWHFPPQMLSSHQDDEANAFVLSQVKSFRSPIRKGFIYVKSTIDAEGEFLLYFHAIISAEKITSVIMYFLQATEKRA
jgi:hypothetical protein